MGVREMLKTKAINIAIKAMEEKRKDFAVGHNVYLKGYRYGSLERDHKRYTELSDAIEILRS